MKKPQRNEDGKESTSWSNKSSVERFNMWKKGSGLDDKVRGIGSFYQGNNKVKKKTLSRLFGTPW